MSGARPVVGRLGPRGAEFAYFGAANLYRARRRIFLHRKREFTARAPGQKMILQRALQIRARCAGANNINTLVCIQQDQTNFNKSQIKLVVIITTQANNITSTSNYSQQIQ
jgi:hypothetical protein